MSESKLKVPPGFQLFSSCHASNRHSLTWNLVSEFRGDKIFHEPEDPIIEDHVSATERKAADAAWAAYGMTIAEHEQREKALVFVKGLAAKPHWNSTSHVAQCRRILGLDDSYGGVEHDVPPSVIEALGVDKEMGDG